MPDAASGQRLQALSPLVLAVAVAAATTAWVVWSSRRRRRKLSPDSTPHLPPSQPPSLVDATSTSQANVDIVPLPPSPMVAPTPHAGPWLEDYVASTLSESDMVRTSSDSLAGRGFVGRMRIGQGDIVLQIKPEVYAPCWPCDVSELEGVERSVIRNDTGAGETFVGSIDGAVVNDEALWTAGELQAHWLLAIRCALKLVPPSSVPSPSPPSATAACTLTALLELEDHGEIRPAASQRAIRNAAERLSSALHRGASLTLAPPDAERLFGVLLTNSFGLRGSGDGTGMEGGLDMRPHALALSLTAAMFNHSCHPNVHTDHRVTGADGVLTFRALRPIAEGTECTIAYVTTEEPTYWRQRALRRSKLFTCRCCVCADPTDGERFGGSFVCTSCGRGWQRQPPPSLSSAASPDAGMVEEDWQCTACGAVRPHAEIIRWDDEQRARLERCLQPSADGDGRAAGQVGARLRRLLCDLQAACHPNHAMLLQARLALVCFGFDDEGEGAPRIGGCVRSSPRRRPRCSSRGVCCHTMRRRRTSTSRLGRAALARTRRVGVTTVGAGGGLAAHARGRRVDAAQRVAIRRHPERRGRGAARKGGKGVCAALHAPGRAREARRVVERVVQVARGLAREEGPAAIEASATTTRERSRVRGVDI